MVWLDSAANNGSVLYLDVFSVERRPAPGGAIHAYTGVLGDGLFEGDVLVEVGERVEVTFADHWLRPARLREFFGRVSRATVVEALAAACAELRDGVPPCC